MTKEASDDLSIVPGGEDGVLPTRKIGGKVSEKTLDCLIQREREREKKLAISVLQYINQGATFKREQYEKFTRRPLVYFFPKHLTTRSQIREADETQLMFATEKF